MTASLNVQLSNLNRSSDDGLALNPESSADDNDGSDILVRNPDRWTKGNGKSETVQVTRGPDRLQRTPSPLQSLYVVRSKCHRCAVSLHPHN